MRYEVVFLDWYKTISDSIFWSDWQNNSDQNKDLRLIQLVMFENGGKLVNNWMRGKLNSEQAVNKICEITKLNQEKVFKGLISSSNNMKLNDANLLQTVEKLRRQGVKVIIATDNMDTFMRWTVPSMQLNQYFDGFIDSFTQKALKADFDKYKSLFFCQYFSSHTIEPSKMILVDDRKDAIIVERAGIDFYHFDRSKTLSKVLDDILTMR